MSEREKQDIEHSGLHEKIDHLLTEARVILPGAQALFGFQLAIVLTDGFEKLSPATKGMHGLALALVCLSVILLMAPAAYHRIVYAGEDSEQFYRTGALLVTCSTVPLALGLAADVFVVATKIVPRQRRHPSSPRRCWFFLSAAGTCCHSQPGAWRNDRRCAQGQRRGSLPHHWRQGRKPKEHVRCILVAGFVDLI